MIVIYLKVKKRLIYLLFNKIYECISNLYEYENENI